MTEMRNISIGGRVVIGSAASPQPPSYVFQLRTLESEMDYASVYQADFPGAVEIGGTYDTSVVADDTTFITNKEVQIDAANRSQIGTAQISTGIAYWEFLIGNATYDRYVGIYPMFAGPPFDANNDNWQYGSPVASYYKSSGEVVGYGVGIVATSINFVYGQGDIIGVVFEANNSAIWFYKNGVKIDNSVPLANNNIKLTSGTYS